jgi:uncharacterized protein (UPF0332 family)
MVIDAGESYLDKAKESVTGARVAYEAGRFNNSANRSYYACFQAAIHALILEGIRPPGGSTAWGHDFVQAQFRGQLVNRRHRYETALRDTLQDNYRMRVRGDYEARPVAEIQAARSFRRAERFVQAVVQRQEERR